VLENAYQSLSFFSGRGANIFLLYGHVCQMNYFLEVFFVVKIVESIGVIGKIFRIPSFDRLSKIERTPRSQNPLDLPETSGIL